MYDWETIKTEFVTTNCSYRQLSEKYGPALAAISRHALRDKWHEARDAHRELGFQKAVKVSADTLVDYRSTVYNLALKMAKKLDDFTEGKSIEEMVKVGIKPRDVTGAVKDIEDALHLKSDVDMREQEARINLMLKQIDDNAEKAIEVVLKGDTTNYAQ